MEKKEFKLSCNLWLVGFEVRLKLPTFKDKKSTKVKIDSESFDLFVNHLLNESMSEVEKLKEEYHVPKDTEEIKDGIEDDEEAKDEIQIIEERHRAEIQEITDEYFRYKDLYESKEQEITELKDYIKVITEENLELRGEINNMKKGCN